MLQILLGADWVANRNYILRAIAEDVRNELPNRILLVPELISHDTERRLCAAAGDTASRFAEVLSFSRMTRRVSEFAGTAVPDCLDSGGRVVAMASVARQLRGELKAYASVASRPEFLSNLVDAVDEFKRCCITPEDLKLAAAKTEGAFAQKLYELSLILEGYNAVTARGKADPRDQMVWLLSQLKDCDFAQSHVFYIDGFPDFTRQNMDVLEHLICDSPMVTVSLNCDYVGSESTAFQKAGETARQLVKLARQRNIPVDIQVVAPENEILGNMCDLLFQGAITETAVQGVLALRAESVYAEVVAVAQKIADLVRTGARYRDICLVCGNMENYRTVITSVFNRYHIPHYLTGTENILERPVVQTVLSALDAALNGFDLSDVIRYLRSALSSLTLSECDLLENYAIIWNINGNKWLLPWENHPQGMGVDWQQKDWDMLKELNRLRCLAVSPLEQLRNSFQSADKLAAKIEALYTFLEDISVAQRLNILADMLDEEGDNRSAQILNQLWEIMMDALEQLHGVLGETGWDNETFTRLLRLLLGQYDVGTIPPVLDTVMIGPASAMRCQEEKHLFVLGVEEGSMPGYNGSTGILTDRERTALRQIGVPLTGGALEGLQAEFSEIYGVFCGARETVTVSCPAGQPSFLYRRICNMAGGEATVQLPYGISDADEIEAAAYLARNGLSDTADDMGLTDAYRKMRESKYYSFGSVNRENVKGLYGSLLNLSASQIDKQADCRLAYFLRYGLRAKERKTAVIDPAEFGTYVHDVLENTAREVMEKGGFRKCTETEVLEIALRYSEAYKEEHFSVLDSQRSAYLFKRNEQELSVVVSELWSELHNSEFAPVDFEVQFGSGGKMPAIVIEGGQMNACVRGFVDRVDRWQGNSNNYFRVVDYKTGKKDFDYCDVFNGLGLQMLLYMFALEQGGETLLGEKPIPAGVQYFPARAPLIASEGPLSAEEATNAAAKEWKRKGLVRNDGDVLSAMEPDGAPKRLDCKISKDGTVVGAVATGEQLQKLKKYIFKLLKVMVDDIASGNVAPNPYTRGSYHNACAFCAYGQVCHPETVAERRDYQAMNGLRFWEELEKEVASHG